MKKGTDSVIKLNTELEINSPYYLGSGILERLVDKLTEYNFDKLFLINDPRVYDLYGKDLFKHLKSNYCCDSIVLREGEIHKNMHSLNSLCEDLIKKEVSKDSILIALGGGVIGNIVGLAAALIYRGIRFIEVPTTMLAQTDSVLSNKQAVNGSRGKNLFGVYYAPIFIWGDVRLLISEGPRHIKSGLVESVKNGLISNLRFLDYLEHKLDGKEARYSEEDLMELVHRSILSKIEIIKEDPTEKKRGIILEYGHTFGHAIEKLSHGKTTHGEGVAIGMAIAAELSQRLGFLKNGGVKKHYYFLAEKMGFDLSIPHDIKIEDILNVIKSDNKRTGKGVKYVILEEIGKVHNPDKDFMVKVEDNLVIDTLRNFV